jgi:hypothetical protein
MELLRVFQSSYGLLVIIWGLHLDQEIVSDDWTQFRNFMLKKSGELRIWMDSSSGLGEAKVQEECLHCWAQTSDLEEAKFHEEWLWKAFELWFK